MRTRSILATLTTLALAAIPADAAHGQSVKKGALGDLPRIEIDSGTDREARHVSGPPAAVEVKPDLVCSIRPSQFGVADGGTITGTGLESMNPVYPPGIAVKILNQSLMGPGYAPAQPFMTKIVVVRDGAKIDQVEVPYDPSKSEILHPLQIDPISVGQQEYRIRAVVDSQNDNHESNEKNNKCKFRFTVEW